MGSSISPTIASIVINDLLDKTIPKLSFSPKLFVKYVDDLLTIVPTRQINNTLAFLNSYHPRLRFTHELERDGKIPYLDLLVIRKDNSIITDWYQKETATEMTLSYLSNHPEKMKDNIAFNLFFRAINLSNSIFHKTNINRVWKILELNHYPKTTIKNQLHKVLQKLQTIPQLTTQNDVEPILRRSITFDKSITGVLTKIVRQESNNHVQPTAKPFKRLQSTVFTKLKTKIEPLQKSHCIYQFPCKGNDNEICNLSYVGQTKNKLVSRLAQHTRSINNGYDPDGQSAVVTHFIEHGHRPNIEEAKILATEIVNTRRTTMESLHIFLGNTYNLRRDTDNIAASYCALLDRCGKKRKKTR